MAGVAAAVLDKRMPESQSLGALYGPRETPERRPFLSLPYGSLKVTLLIISPY